MKKDNMNYENNIFEHLGDTPDNNEPMDNPWWEPISYIAGGLILSSMTINFLWLQFILPTIGTALVFVGFRSMRKVNKYFTAAYYISIITMFKSAAYLIFASTPWFTKMQNGAVIGMFGTGLQIAILLIFRSAIRVVFKKADASMPRDPLLWATVWTGLGALCAVSSLSSSGLAAILLIAFFISIIHSLLRLRDDLGDLGYCLISAPVKTSDAVVIWGYTLVCFLLVLCSSAITNHTVPKFTEMAVVTNSDTRNTLLKLGFPEQILKDIPDENISMLQNTIHVDASTDILMFNGVNETVKVGHNKYEVRKNPRYRTVEATTVYAELPGNELYVLVYFKWQNPKVFWNDGFTIWGEDGFEPLDGALLYRKDNTDYIAPILRFNCNVVTTNSMFFGENQSRQITGGICYPFGSENQRGYVFYRLQLPEAQWLGNNCFNYYHSISLINFPYSYPEQRTELGNYKQHFTMFYLQAYREAHNK